MLVKLRFLISKCNRERRSCASIAQNAGKVAIFDFEVRSSVIVCVHRTKCGPTCAFWFAVRPYVEMVLVHRVKCWYNCVFRFRRATPCGDRVRQSRETLMQSSWRRDLAREILVQKCCTSGSTASEADIVTERSRPRDPLTEILREWSYKISVRSSWHRGMHKKIAYRDFAHVVPQRFWHRHFAEEILIHRSCTSAPTGPRQRDPKHVVQAPRAEILHQRSHRTLTQKCWHRDPAREIRRKNILHKVIQGLDAEILAQKKSAHRDFAQVVLQDICVRRSCTRALAGPCWGDTKTPHKRSSCTDLAQGAPDQRFLIQRSRHRRLAQEILI